MSVSFSFFRLLSLLLLVLASLYGCAVGPDYKEPPAPKVSRYTEKPISTKLATAPDVPGGTQQELEENADIPAQWWALYKSPELEALIQKALEQNPTLGAADAALRSAQQNLYAQIGGQYFPAFSLNGSGARQQVPPAAYGQSGPTSIYNLYNANVGVTYKLDVFGGARRTVESARAQAEYQQYQLEGAYLSLTSNIVTSAIKEAALEAQLLATRDILDSQKKQAAIAEKQLIIGTASKIDVSSQETLVSTSEVDLINYEKNLSIIRNQLAVYVGEQPSSANIAAFNLSTLNLPEKIPLSLPSSLVRQRPDVKAAEANLKSTNALVGVATANLLPQFNITGSIGSEALTTGALFGPSAALWSVGGAVFQPLFQGGQLIAQRRGAVANYEQAVFQYQATVLSAFQQVADALKALETGARALRSASNAERYAYETLKLSEIQYKLGTTSYFQVLYYQTQYQQAKIKSIQAQANRFSDTAALFAALGGGWWNRTEPAFQPKVNVNENQNDTPWNTKASIDCAR